MVLCSATAAPFVSSAKNGSARVARQCRARLLSMECRFCAPPGRPETPCALAGVEVPRLQGLRTGEPATETVLVEKVMEAGAPGAERHVQCPPATTLFISPFVGFNCACPASSGGIALFLLFGRFGEAFVTRYGIRRFYRLVFAEFKDGDLSDQQDELKFDKDKLPLRYGMACAGDVFLSPLSNKMLS